MKLLQATENYLDKKVRLPVVKEEFFYPTEASVELIEDGEKKIIGNCLRASYYRYKGGFTGSAFSSYTQWIFLTGKAVESELIDKWKEMGIWVDNNIKFRSVEHHISGEIDVVIRDPQTGELILVECKTYYGYEATKELCGNPKKGIVGQPKDQNLLQILIYLYLHQHIFARGKLIYIDKTCKDHAEFDITLSKEGDNTYPIINGVVKRRFSVEQILERYQKLEDHVDTNILPDRDFELVYSTDKIEKLFAEKKISKTKYEKWQKKGTPIGDWNCNYCRYKIECYGLDAPSTEPDDTDE